ncbi:MAG: SulP family inorganic anion transporter [Candidatus Gracilibacteria bacterium]|nr:SulP family inorganic anion transporter [Candidatus Gracilibacteria bacterium]
MNKTQVLSNLKSNWKSGLSVAMINIPLSISLAVASGASPLQGLLTGIWGGMIAAIFASSKYNIFGAAGALSGILLSFSLINGPWLLPFIAIFSGIIIMIVYWLKITKYITLIPTTALHGFLIGVGITIAVGQFNAALGLVLKPSEKIYIGLWQTFLNLGSVNLSAFAMFLVGFIFLLFTKKKYPNFPAVIVLTIAGVLFGYAIKGGYLPSIRLLSDQYKGMSFSPFQNIFSAIRIKDFSDFMDIFRKVISVSIIVAIIAILETIISAKIAQTITKVKFSREKEVFGLGMSNIASGLFGGLPVTAVFVRTALNINAGGKSRYSAFLAGLFTLLFSLLFFNNGFLFLPYPIIAAILINIAIGLIDIKHLKKLYSMQHGAFYVAIITAFFTVVEDPTFGIVIGTAIALIAYLKRITSSGAKISLFRNSKFHEKLDLGHYIHNDQKDGDIILLKFSGGLNYLNQEKNIHHLELIDKKIKIVLSFSHMGDLDIDGVETIDETFMSLNNRGIEVYFSGLSLEFEKIMSKTHIYKLLHKENKVINPTSEVLNILLGDKYNT